MEQLFISPENQFMYDNQLDFADERQPYYPYPRPRPRPHYPYYHYPYYHYPHYHHPHYHHPHYPSHGYGGGYHHY